MNILTLSLANLKFRALNSLFHIIVLALGIAAIITLLHISQQLEQRFTRDLKGIDLVLGAKGSPLQLILSSVFHIDIPTGNIPLSEAQKIAKNPMVRASMPIALGDNVQGFRIVGTSQEYPKHYGAELAEGVYWDAEMQAVLGSDVARRTGLRVGDTFSGSHGLTQGGEAHSEFPYVVKGILKPTGTVIDRVVLTDVESVWHIHEHHQHHEHKEGEEHHHHEEQNTNREITALLIAYKSPAAAVTLPRLINQNSSLQAASPAFETARLIKIMGVGSEAITLFAGILIAIATVGFFVTLCTAVNERRYDIALMRSLGATRKKILGFVLAEGLTLGMLGVLVGFVLGHILASVAASWIEQSHHLLLNAVGFHPHEAYLLLLAIGISIVASILPAITAYRTNIATILSKGF